MVSLRPVFSVLIIGVAFYAVFYPQPYLNEALRNVPIAIVDRDGTSTSRELARRIDATPDVSIAVAMPDLVSAEREVYTRSVSGILVIPEYFERDLLHGRASPVALYSDASYFLLNQRISGAVSAVALQLGAEVEATRLINVGIDPAIARAAADPMPLTSVALFNPQAGYATYVLPGAFVLILQQTLLIGVGLLGTLPGADPRRRTQGAGWADVWIAISGKLLAYLVFEMLTVLLYLIVLPYFYGVPRLGSAAAVLFFAVPFILSVGALGLLLAAVFRNPLTFQLTTAAIGLPFFFLAGFAWPTEAIPAAVRELSLVVPSTSAIDGLVRVGQLGAPLSDARTQLVTLWGLAILYGCLAALLEVRTRQRPKSMSSNPLPPDTVLAHSSQ
jgi:ABC-2 type transport system permease protein